MLWRFESLLCYLGYLARSVCRHAPLLSLRIRLLSILRRSRRPGCSPRRKAVRLAHGAVSTKIGRVSIRSITPATGHTRTGRGFSRQFLETDLHPLGYPPHHAYVRLPPAHRSCLRHDLFDLQRPCIMVLVSLSLLVPLHRRPSFPRALVVKATQTLLPRRCTTARRWEQARSLDSASSGCVDGCIHGCIHGTKPLEGL